LELPVKANDAAESDHNYFDRKTVDEPVECVQFVSSLKLINP